MGSLVNLRQRRSVKLLFVLLLLFSVSSIIGGCGYDDNVTAVREGSFHAYPNIPIGDAFDDFFKNSKWKSFTSDKGQTIVEFTGECLFYNKEAEVTIQFVLYKNKEFETIYTSINDVPLNIFESGGLLEKVMSSYEK